MRDGPSTGAALASLFRPPSCSSSARSSGYTTAWRYSRSAAARRSE